MNTEIPRWDANMFFFPHIRSYATLLTAPGSEGYGSRLVSVVPGVWFSIKRVFDR